MKFFTNKETTKKIIVAILLVMSFNFISPNISEAYFGGKLFKPISQLLCAIADLVIAGLQDVFIGISDIKSDGTYSIAYSPGMIFSNEVPALDVDFIRATNTTKQVEVTKQIKDYTNVIEALNYNQALQKVRDWENNGSIFTTYYIKQDRLIESYEDATTLWDVNDEDEPTDYDPYSNESDITESLKSKVSKESMLTWYGFSSTTEQTIQTAWFSEKDNCAYVIVTSETLSHTSDITGSTSGTDSYFAAVYLFRIPTKDRSNKCRELN